MCRAPALVTGIVKEGDELCAHVTDYLAAFCSHLELFRKIVLLDLVAQAFYPVFRVNPASRFTQRRKNGRILHTFSGFVSRIAPILRSDQEQCIAHCLKRASRHCIDPVENAAAGLSRIDASGSLSIGIVRPPREPRRFKGFGQLQSTNTPARHSLKIKPGRWPAPRLARCSCRWLHEDRSTHRIAVMGCAESAQSR